MPSVYRHLCAPFEPDHLYDPLFQQYSQDHKWVFAIRPVCTKCDVPILADWVAQLANSMLSGKAVSDIGKDHATWLKSKNSQSFLCFIGKEPLLQVDVHDARIHEVSVAFKDLRRGDYYLEFIYPSKRTRSLNKMVFAMQSFVEYVKKFPEVKRLMSRIGPGNDMGMKIILKSQFKFKGILETDPMAFAVYALTIDGTPPSHDRPLLLAV